MNTQSLRQYLLLTLLTLLLLPAQPAAAHKVNIFAYGENGTVYTESYFPDGRPVDNGTVNVYDRAGTELLKGHTDDAGLFSFADPGKGSLTIEIVASMGHKNSFTLSGEELSPVSGSATATAATDKTTATTGTALTAANTDQMLLLLKENNTRLSAELRAIKKEIATLRASLEKPGINDIAGGIGYILGLLGVAFFFMNRSRQ